MVIRRVLLYKFVRGGAVVRQHLLHALLLAGSLGVQAQIHKMERTDSSMTTRTYNLNPVVVTGSGHHQRLKSTATPVHVLSAQEIHEQGITNFGDALTRMMPQASMAPNSMGTFLRLNGLGNKYILILINGQKLSGDISNNVDLSRINMSRLRRHRRCHQHHHRPAHTASHQRCQRYQGVRSRTVHRGCDTRHL